MGVGYICGEKRDQMPVILQCQKMNRYLSSGHLDSKSKQHDKITVVERELLDLMICQLGSVASWSNSLAPLFKGTIKLGNKRNWVLVPVDNTKY